MKRTIITLLALAGVAGAETLTFQLPSTAPATTFLNNTQDAVNPLGGQTWESMRDSMKGKSYGVYAGCQYQNITTTGNNPWGTNNEGNWVLNEDGTGAITLLGRSGVGGDACVLVLGGEVAAGTTFSSLTFNAALTTASTIEGNITLGLALADSSGKVLASDGGTTLAANAVGSASQTLTFSENITWAEGYKVIAIIDGVSGAATTAYTVSGISVTGQVVPEPATATLSLLALAGLAARRRRTTR